jgi:hypothetical protein
MSDVEQGLWGKLGWDESSWEEETDAPEADDKDWEEMSVPQREALGKLGYTQELWDGVGC